MRPVDFWKLTFAEYWPIYNALTGKIVKPLDELEVEELENLWVTGGKS
jgi:hypothetical protein